MYGSPPNAGGPSVAVVAPEAGHIKIKMLEPVCVSRAIVHDRTIAKSESRPVCRDRRVRFEGAPSLAR
jgi:hypothetical protein